jgi:hypothetical protein
VAEERVRSAIAESSPIRGLALKVNAMALLVTDRERAVS